MAKALKLAVICTAESHVKAQFDEFAKEFPEIRKAATDFNLLKKQTSPMTLPEKMKDHVLREPLKGIRECHLADDVLLLYTHKRNVIHMLYICRHSDLYGKRQRQLAALINRLQ